ncbi:DUF4391 domain-containing protein [Bifidobacterium vespertilionis]|uniref:DUF4391 domain-containing protein n=1 Tax=Bifidobacterium vespertilionis TaxID=2562524 RepID=UPI001BDD2AC5|nr:DUF4391 domain-containing protein [Bifidobacterium vespertilionis]MBT1179817.1 DUF4391 domain-containing protein [Bifidobacterium vespertilionis]
MMSVATCGTVSVTALGLPDSIAIPAAKGTLPKAAFVGKSLISAKLKAHLVNDVASITLLGLLRPANAGVADGVRVHEILVLGLRLNGAGAKVPEDVVEHIAAQRKGGILFVCVRDRTDSPAKADAKAGSPAGKPAQSSQSSKPSRSDRPVQSAQPSQPVQPGEQCALAVRRRIPGRAGHVEHFSIYTGEWQDPADMLVELEGTTMDEVWDGLCSQVILGSADHADLDERIARRDLIAALEADEARLAGDHARAKDPAKRNEAFAKLAKVRAQLKQLRTQ